MQDVLAPRRQVALRHTNKDCQQEEANRLSPLPVVILASAAVLGLGGY